MRERQNISEEEEKAPKSHGTAKPGYLKAGLIFAVLLPAAFAFWILSRQQFSLPYQDDYRTILEFATQYRHLPSVPARVLYVATKQDNDYKLGFAHAVVAMQLESAGHLDFGLLVFLGNCFLLGIAYVLWLIYGDDESTVNQRLIEFLPASLLFFSLSYWETVDWAMAALQNLTVIFFSLLSVYLLIPKKADASTFGRFLGSCFSAVLASMCSANGFLLGPIGVFVLLRRRALGYAAVWCAAFVLPITAYLYHYRPYHVSVGTIHNGFYAAKAFYFFAFLGCAIHRPVFAAVAGVVVTIVFCATLWQRIDRSNPAAFYSALWGMMTAGLVGFLRQSIAPRYSIYSLLGFIFCYFALLQFVKFQVPSAKHNHVYAACICLTLIFFCITNRQATSHLRERRGLVIAGMEYFQENPELNAPIVDPLVLQLYPEEPAIERQILNQAIQERIYQIPQYR